MACNNDKAIPYEEAFASQIPILGSDGQGRLRDSRVAVVGVGRVGSSTASCLAAAGVGRIFGIDRQVVTADSLNSSIYGTGDVRSLKVIALKRRLLHHPHTVISPLPYAVESEVVNSYIASCDLVICCANTVAARLTTEKKALRFAKPSMQVGLFDGRERLGGLIALRLNENPSSACAGCYLDQLRTRQSIGELLATAAAALAGIAANIAVAVLTGRRGTIVQKQNFFYVDLESYAIDAFATQRRRDCTCCGVPGG